MAVHVAEALSAGARPRERAPCRPPTRLTRVATIGIEEQAAVLFTPAPRTAAQSPDAQPEKRRRGGGGAGQPREQRADPVRRELVHLDPIQEAVIENVVDRYLDSDERLQYCKKQRTQRRPSPSCPLSPPGAKSKRSCSETSCGCELSFTTVALQNGILSPSLVRARLCGSHPPHEPRSSDLLSHAGAPTLPRVAGEQPQVREERCEVLLYTRRIRLCTESEIAA